MQQIVSGGVIVLKSVKHHILHNPLPFKPMGDSLGLTNSEGYLDCAPAGKPLRVVRLIEGDLSLKLIEMGCLPGQWVEIVHRASGGRALALRVAEYVLALRAEEAKAVLVRWGESPLVAKEFSTLTLPEG